MISLQLLPLILTFFTGPIDERPNHSATPQAAALAALYGHPVVVRTNIAWPFATVLTRGGLMESEKVDSPILVEHFSFGWQAIEILNFRCRFTAHRAGAVLMHGMPSFKDDSTSSECDENADVGSKADVERIRLRMEGPLIPSVRIAGDYALGQWYGGGGGMALYVRHAGGWKRIARGGGALLFRDLRSFGIPLEDACVLIAAAKCPPADASHS